jgi:hypothetical protein
MLLILGFAAAQFITLARACAIDRAHAPVFPAMVAGAAAAMPADCPFMAAGRATPVACEAQCMPQAQADKGADVKIPLGPPAVLVVRQLPAVHAFPLRAMPPLARNASPPFPLLYGRLLI